MRIVPNFFQICYAIGKVHTGMLYYLCEQFNDGNAEPAENFFSALGIKTLPSRLKLVREWNGIDLVIFSDEKTPKSICMFEIKVDDHEHYARGTAKWQTELYPALLPDCKKHFFVTLGAGEYYHKPQGPEFVWVKIREFHKCLCEIRTSDVVLQSWIDAIGHEIILQEFAISGNTSLRKKYRTGAWNIYFLGKLRDILLSEPFRGSDKIDATAYMYGTRPDTILNFGWLPDEISYMEINNNGRLNLKATIESFDTVEKKRTFISNHASELKYKFSRFAPIVSNRDPKGGSHTILSFDVGLKEISDGILGYVRTPSETISILREILGTFYA